MHTPLYGPKFSQFHAVFSQNLAKSYVGAPPRAGAPYYGKSWIRPWNDWFSGVHCESLKRCTCVCVCKCVCVCVCGCVPWNRSEMLHQIICSQGFTVRDPAARHGGRERWYLCGCLMTYFYSARDGGVMLPSPLDPLLLCVTLQTIWSFGTGFMEKQHGLLPSRCDSDFTHQVYSVLGLSLILWWGVTWTFTLSVVGRTQTLHVRVFFVFFSVGDATDNLWH